jgi:hypothetical protein
MREENPAMEAPVQEARRPGLLGHVFGLWTSPGETFHSILRRPQIVAPLLVLVAIQLAFTGVWLRQVDKKEFLKTQMEEAGQWEKIPVDSRPQVLEQQTGFFTVIAWVSALLGAAVVALVIASVYLFVFRFFYASSVKFKPALSIVAHAFLAVGLVTTPLTLLVLKLRDDWNIHPQYAIQANLSLALGDREDVPKFLWSFAESLDLFSFWLLFLLAVGFGAASSRRWTSVLAGVLAPWALYVVCKSTASALF